MASELLIAVTLMDRHLKKAGLGMVRNVVLVEASPYRSCSLLGSVSSSLVDQNLKFFGIIIAI